MRLVQALLVASLTGGCDGLIYLEGRAYEWVNAPVSARSAVYIDSSRPDTIQLIRLEGVRVTLFHGADYSRVMYVGTTIQTGLLRLGGACPPWRFQAAIRATKQGFQPAEAVFVHDEETDHTVAIVLVRTLPDTAPRE